MATAFVAITKDTTATIYTGGFANHATITCTDPTKTLMTGDLTLGSPLNTSVGTLRAAGTGMHAHEASATNEGLIVITGDNGAGMKASVNGANIGTVKNAAINSGTITTTGTNTYGMTAINAVLFNSGSIESRGAGAHAIHVTGTSAVHLQEGTNIIAGGVYGERESTLYLDGGGVANFDIAGAWGGITKTGSGTWRITQPPSTTNTSVVVSGGTLALGSGVGLTLGKGTYTQSAETILSLSCASTISAARATVTGGILRIEPSAAIEGSTVIISTTEGVTGNLTVVSGNPHFTATTTNTGNQIILKQTSTKQ